MGAFSIPQWVEIGLLLYTGVGLLLCGVVLVPVTPLGKALARMMGTLAVLFFWAVMSRAIGDNEVMFWVGVAMRITLAACVSQLLVELVRVVGGPGNAILLTNDAARSVALRAAQYTRLRRRREP